MLPLSIVIPVYNTGKYLRKCVDSVMDAQFSDYELIIIDDGSTDDSLSVARELADQHPERIRLVQQENKGIGGARNTGIEEATGNYLFQIDSDDYLAPGALDRIAPFLSNDFDMLIFDAVLVDEQGKKIEAMPGCKKKDVTSFTAYPELLFEFPAPWNKIVRRSIFLDQQIQYPLHVWYEDLRVTSKLYPHADRVVYLDEALYRYVLHSGSIMNSSKCERNLEIITAIDDIVNYYREIGLYETYKTQLEFLAFTHQLIVATTRVNQIDHKSPVLSQLKNDFLQKFPAYRSNPYVQQLPKKERLVLYLLLHNHYDLLYTLMSLKKKLKGKSL